MRYLITTVGAFIPTLYAQQVGKTIFWVANRKKATTFNKIKARKLAASLGRYEKVLIQVDSGGER